MPVSRRALARGAECGTEARGAVRPLCRAWEESPLCGAPVLGRVIVCWAWFRLTPVMPGVIPDGRDTDERSLCQVCYHAGVVGACHSHPNELDRSAEHAVAADRFAREIVEFWIHFLWRARGG